MVLFASPILANIGLPMVAVFLPPAWLALIPIIIIESAYGAWRLKLPAGRAFAAQALANCASTLIGIPVTWFALVLVEWLVLERAGSILPKPMVSVLSPIVGAAWLGPAEQERLGIVVVAGAVLTVVFYVMSVTTEGFIVARFFRNVPRELIQRWSFQANAITYALLVALICSAWAVPRTSQKAFTLVQPVNDWLVDSVFWVADRVSGSGERENALTRAVGDGDLARVRKLIAKGTNVNSPGNDGGTALQSAAAAGDEKMTQLLLDAGADVNARRTGPINYDALDYAAWTGNGATIRVLLSGGARVNDRVHEGWTPLMISMLYGHRDVVEALLAGGADVNARSPAGWTALKEARFQGNQQIADRLIRAGAIDYPDGSRD